MYFSKITLKPNTDQASFANALCNNTYKEHQILWQLFDNDPTAKRDFIYRYEPQRNTPAYYMVSKRKPVDNNHLWKIETKKYAPVITTGRRFAFLLRVNPVITKDGKHHDAVMHEKHRMGFKNIDSQSRPASQEIIENAGLKWLTNRAENSGFSIKDSTIRIDGYQPHTSGIKGEGRKRGKKEIRYSTMDYRGVLTVTDPEKFEQTLMLGIGKARAFGCGLMLIRRAS